MTRMQEEKESRHIQPSPPEKRNTPKQLYRMRKLQESIICPH